MNVKKASQIKPLSVPSNPFASEHLARIPFRFEEGDWNSNLARLRKLDYRAAIVGPHGSGKSTLISELESRIASQTSATPYLLVIPANRDEHTDVIETALTHAAEGKVLLVDGIERVSLRQKFRLFRGTVGRGGLVVTSAYPMRLPPFTLTTWVKTATSELLLDYVLSELQMASPDVRAAGQESYEKNRGNIGRVLEELYERHSAKRFK